MWLTIEFANKIRVAPTGNKSSLQKARTGIVCRTALHIKASICLKFKFSQKHSRGGDVSVVKKRSINLLHYHRFILEWGQIAGTSRVLVIIHYGAAVERVLRSWMGFMLAHVRDEFDDVVCEFDRIKRRRLIGGESCGNVQHVPAQVKFCNIQHQTKRRVRF